MPDETQLVIDHLQSSSALSFARSLFHAAEGKELFDQGFAFASAVSIYYSLFHLGGALILAYCSRPASADEPHACMRRELEKRWKSRSSLKRRPDPAAGIQHDTVPAFLERELPELFQSLGKRNCRNTLRDMREFVNYAPRMVRNGFVNILYSGCQYEAQDFKRHLKGHLDSIDEFFHSSTKWMNERGCNEVRSRLLSGDFVLFEFSELLLYHPESVAKRAWAIYCSMCKHEGVDWRVHRSAPGIFHTDEDAERRRYSEVVCSFS